MYPIGYTEFDALLCSNPNQWDMFNLYKDYIMSQYDDEDEDVVVVITIYNNYDCCNSFDEYEPEGYIYEVHQHIKDAVPKESYMYEFLNGAYGGSLFCFIAKMHLSSYEYINDRIKNSKDCKIFIPMGTQYGFLETGLHGCSSLFESKTIQDLILPVRYGDTKYDHLGVSLDGDSIYSIGQIFGDTNWIDKSDVKLL